jgi:hypothetical protein
VPERCILAEDEPALSYFQHRLLVDWLASPETSDSMLDRMSEFRNPEHKTANQRSESEPLMSGFASSKVCCLETTRVSTPGLSALRGVVPYDSRRGLGIEDKY